MARMLQALKNLEARSAKTAGKGWLAQLAEKPGNLLPAPTAAKAVEDPPGAMVVAERQPEVRRPMRRGDAPAAEFVAAESFGEREGCVAVEERAGAAARREPRPPDERLSEKGLSENSPPARQPSSLERQVRRTLGDPARVEPLGQLAERLRRDAEQSASKTLLLVGVGESSTTHEAALYAAALLAERHGERVLLIDADLARRPLSSGLEYGQSPGLMEMLRGSAAVRAKYQATALPGVSLLPAGNVRDVDVGGAAPRLEEVLQEVAADFSLVLIDGGRASEQSTTLARLADATYFVVQLGAVEKCEAQGALRDFRAAGARVVGCIAT